ncbi:ABC transporter ATP-binding protein [Pseudogemmobacter bohemicus]|uniref:ABC transporter ATP-binding protein n=1 Tax=Pseudogemmobacter bohemicus TaxID=2250708 RepID=UPI000DD2B935|nr:ABC transporter ATP-binding protein [Pseudogemmobacter bohemicus]
MSSAALLELRQLSRRFGPGQAAVEDLSLDLSAGEILALIGPSGCGKTTTLRMVAGFETPDQGAVRLSGRDITALAPERRGIGMVFQDYALFPHMTVAQNVLFGAVDRAPATAARYLEMVGLVDYAGRYPDELSGGQQQRVALARTFAAGPGVILLDEPFSNLDASLRARTRREIRALLKATGIGILFVTHDQEEALSFADRVAVMENGRLLQCGPAAEVYDRPANAFVAGFLGRTNLITGDASGETCDTVLGQITLEHPASGQVGLSVRPERIAIRAAEARETPQGRISAVEFKGHDLTYWVSCQGVEIQVDQMGGPRLMEGAPVVLTVAGAVAAFG